MKHSFKTSLSHSFNEIIDPLIHSGAHVSLKSPALFWDVGQNMAFRLKVDYRDRSCNIHLGLVAQSCPTLCDPMGCSPAGFSARGILQARILQYTCRLPCPLPGNLHNPGIKPRSPVLQADSLLSETPGKPKNIGVPYRFSRGSSWARNQTRIFCIASRFFTSWATREAHNIHVSTFNHFRKWLLSHKIWESWYEINETSGPEEPLEVLHECLRKNIFYGNKGFMNLAVGLQKDIWFNFSVSVSIDIYQEKLSSQELSLLTPPSGFKFNLGKNFIGLGHFFIQLLVEWMW